MDLFLEGHCFLPLSQWILWWTPACSYAYWVASWGAAHLALLFKSLT